MVSYLEKESKCNATLGPFHYNPFQRGMKISPLNTVPKKKSLKGVLFWTLVFHRALQLTILSVNMAYCR